MSTPPALTFSQLMQIYIDKDHKADSESTVLTETGKALIAKVQGAINFGTTHNDARANRLVSIDPDTKLTDEILNIFNFYEYTIGSTPDKKNISQEYSICILKNKTIIYKITDMQDEKGVFNVPENISEGEGAKLALGRQGELRILHGLSMQSLKKGIGIR